MTDKQTEALKLALEALEKMGRVMKQSPDTEKSIAALRDALAEQPAQPKCNSHPKAPHGFDRNASHSADRYVCDCESWEPYDAGYQAGFEKGLMSLENEQPAQQQEPVRLRRGNILRCIETDELCTVWSTSTTGKTLVKWNANEFGAYTAEQIGELFWLEPEPDDLELAAEKSDNYAAFHAGYRFAVAHSSAEQPAQKRPQNCGTGYCSCIECLFEQPNIAKYLEKDNSEQPAQQQDIADLIAGALGVSRGTAYDMMREALAEAQQQEPFGYFKPEPFGWTDCAETDEGAIALYERPPASKPLTDEQIRIIWRDIDGSEGMIMRFARAVEAAHGIKGDA